MSFSIKALRDNRPVLETIKSVSVMAVATVSCEAISCWFPCVFLFVCLVFSCRLVFCLFPFVFDLSGTKKFLAGFMNKLTIIENVSQGS